MTARARDWPRGLLATATHDHKRGEDVRARLAVLSTMPARWLTHVRRWNALAETALDGVDPADAYMLYQTLYGAWPQGLATDDRDGLAAFAERVTAWQQKALREGKLRSSWEAPQEEYEARCAALTRALLDPIRSAAFLADLAELRAIAAPAADAAMLVQMALRLTVPGVPDTYQGTELPDLSLVDPDNRRPVDYSARVAALADGSAPKLALMARLLGLRRDQPALFAEGDYRAVPAEGPRAADLLAFTREHRGERLFVAVALRGLAEDWGDTALSIGDEKMQAAALFAEKPVIVRID